jgi:hypothetical protein
LGITLALTFVTLSSPMPLTLITAGHRGAAEPGVRRGGGLGIAKFEFKGKAFLITLIDLPFSVSPVSPAWSTC